MAVSGFYLNMEKVFLTLFGPGGGRIRELLNELFETWWLFLNFYMKSGDINIFKIGNHGHVI